MSLDRRDFLAATGGAVLGSLVGRGVEVAPKLAHQSQKLRCQASIGSV